MAEVVTKRHPIRAALWGILLGLGLIIWFTFAQPVIGFDNIASVLTKWGIVLVGAMVLAIVLALILPAKKPKGPPPDAAHPTTAVAGTAAATAADPAQQDQPADPQAPAETGDAAGQEDGSSATAE